MLKKVTCRVIDSSPLRGHDFKSIRQYQHDSEGLQIHSTKGSNIHKNNETNPTVYSNLSGKALPIKFIPVFGQFVDYYA
ncbi:MAG: hypothetical protein ACYTBP_02105 [Planctomycetota bacterium]|jgi:hypothetical protein